jgi:hypothetical protein
MAGALAAVGCDSGTEPGTATGPPLEKGNRKRLEMLKNRTEEIKAKTKTN